MPSLRRSCSKNKPLQGRGVEAQNPYPTFYALNTETAFRRQSAEIGLRIELSASSRKSRLTVSRRWVAALAAHTTTSVAEKPYELSYRSAMVTKRYPSDMYAATPSGG
jgi:hypothetical protein